MSIFISAVLKAFHRGVWQLKRAASTFPAALAELVGKNSKLLAANKEFLCIFSAALCAACGVTSLQITQIRLLLNFGGGVGVFYSSRTVTLDNDYFLMICLF